MKKMIKKKYKRSQKKSACACRFAAMTLSLILVLQGGSAALAEENAQIAADNTSSESAAVPADTDAESTTAQPDNTQEETEQAAAADATESTDLAELLAQLTALQEENETLRQDLEDMTDRAVKWKKRYKELKAEYDELTGQNTEKKESKTAEEKQTGKEKAESEEKTGSEENAGSEEKVESEEKAGSEKKTDKEKKDKVTSGMKEALQAAKDYLSYMAFSYNGLVEQLEYTGYTTKEATYAADHCGADWKEQAVIRAKDYMGIAAFSLKTLTEQLENVGFTPEEAAYGANEAYM